MERVALIGGIILAAFFAVGGLVHFEFDFDDDGWNRGRLAAFVQPAAEKSAERAYDANSVRLRDVAAVVHVVPEDRADIAIGFDNPGQAPSPVITLRGGTLVVDGRLSGRVRDCHDDDAVTLRDYGRLPRAALPVITIRAPRAFELAMSGAVYADVGAAGSLDLRTAGCGRTEIGDMTGHLEVHSSGPGEVVAGASESADLHASGSGSVRIGRTGSLEISVNGSGMVEVASAEGDAEVKISGSGGVRIGGGALDNAEFNITGSGDMDVTAPIVRLETNIVGSGGIVVRRPVQSIDADFIGSGDVTLIARPGEVDQSTIGSGGIVIEPSAATAPARPVEPAAPAKTLD